MVLVLAVTSAENDGRQNRFPHLGYSGGQGSVICRREMMTPSKQDQFLGRDSEQWLCLLSPPLFSLGVEGRRVLAPRTVEKRAPGFEDYKNI